MRDANPIFYHFQPVILLKSSYIEIDYQVVFWLNYSWNMCQTVKRNGYVVETKTEDVVISFLAALYSR